MERMSGAISWSAVAYLLAAALILMAFRMFRRRCAQRAIPH